MPGFNLPLNLPPTDNYVSYQNGFPNALDPYDLEHSRLDYIVAYREIIMMRVMNAITDKPGWEKKVFDEHIVTKWRAEIARTGEDVSERMLDWIIKELRWKAGLLENIGYIQVFDDGVVKSDTAISKELQAELKRAVAPLENIPEEKRDYHPGSDRKVVDLVHPSLFPLIYGRTRVLPDRVLGLDDSLQSIGEGDVLSIPEADINPPVKTTGFNRWTLHPNSFSTTFQWLPCDVNYTEEGSCRIGSYINNAHPVKHRALYGVVEKILSRTFPLWEKSLAEKKYDGERILYRKVEYEESSEPEPVFPEVSTQAEEEEYEERNNAWWASRKIILPEPGEFQIPGTRDLDLRKKFPDQQFQVIVKLANIELTPNNPDYEGGAWHIEGQLNERIAASAIYYYDCENITSSALAFRHRGVEIYFDELSYEQDQHQFLQQVYGFPDDVDGHNDAMITQDLGSVVCKESRLITFPNTLQHKVLPFSLADPSKPGHRKILALFLVDPWRRIISSANVPPQREDWRPKLNAGEDIAVGQQRKVTDSTQSSTMTMEEAKAYRLELMKERGLRSEKQNSAYEEGAFCLCEH
ncbi:hypothetical protein BDV12DRAFT_172555 [Aspergillus spectabilis]